MLCRIISLGDVNSGAVLYAYIIEDFAQNRECAARPAVLVSQSGEDTELSDRETESIALQFTTMGYHAFVLRETKCLPETEKKGTAETGVWKMAAMERIREHAEEWKISADQIWECVIKAPEDVGAGLPESGEMGEETSQDEGSYEKPPSYYSNIYHDRAGMFRHSPFSLEKVLTHHVIEGEKELALDTLGEIRNRGNKAVLAKEPLRSAKNSIICSCTFLTRAAIQAGVPDEEAFALSDAAIQYIEILTGIQEVLDYETEILLQVIGLVKKYKGKHYSTPVRRALHYIDSHLETVLRLGDVAEYAKVHPNYLSRCFKEETGTTISAYISTHKIQEAAYFVQHTDYPMAEISGLYGFSSQSHFISSFKKVMGISPGEYRNQSMI